MFNYGGALEFVIEAVKCSPRPGPPIGDRRRWLSSSKTSCKRTNASILYPASSATLKRCRLNRGRPRCGLKPKLTLGGTRPRRAAAGPTIVVYCYGGGPSLIRLWT